MTGYKVNAVTASIHSFFRGISSQRFRQVCRSERTNRGNIRIMSIGVSKMDIDNINLVLKGSSANCACCSGNFVIPSINEKKVVSHVELNMTSAMGESEIISRRRRKIIGKLPKM